MDDMFVFTERVLQAEPTATLPKPNLGELTRQLVDPKSNHAIYQDELPAGGKQRKFPREKNESIYNY